MPLSRPAPRPWPSLLAAAVLLLLPSALIAGRPDGPASGDDIRSQVEAREIAFARTMADRNLEAFKSFISPEAVFFAGSGPLQGREAVVAAWAGFFEGETAPFSWRPDLVVVLESGRLALSTGPVLSATGEEVARFNSIWRRDEDGQWRVVFDKGCP